MAVPPTDSPVEISIIVVNWNVRDLLRECLRSISSGTTLPSHRYEVFVADNNSRDGSVAMVTEEFPEVTIIANQENLGFARANNEVFPKCQGRLILLLNPDTRVLDGALDTLVEVLSRRPEVGAVGCRLVDGVGATQRWTGGAFPSIGSVACHYLFLDRFLPRWLRSRSMFLHDLAGGEIEVDWVSGACVLLRREALNGSLFSDRFFLYAEDLELCHRLGEQGWKVVYTTAASVVHHHNRSMEQQRSLEIQINAITAPRRFYMMLHGRAWVWLHDLIILTGYLIRWFMYRILAIVRPRGGHGAMATSCRHHAAMIVKVAFQR